MANILGLPCRVVRAAAAFRSQPDTLDVDRRHDENFGECEGATSFSSDLEHNYFLPNPLSSLAASGYGSERHN